MRVWDKFYPREPLIFLALGHCPRTAPQMAPEHISYIITLNRDGQTSKVQSQDAPGLPESDLKVGSH